MTTEFTVVICYLDLLTDYTVRAGDARIAASKGLKLFAKASSYVGPLYRNLSLRPGQSLTVCVTR